ncbi:Olfactory receptor 5W2 [Heterocephalus glaber]|uniref:Olfactory receptor 5W2 n=1 Tax=Heterocephalus glaber TaxID=10181 RepID=G5BGP3_HETGA|nr:Olfactory receptor 5W2 [Heterocephalus glaber]
MDRGNCSSLTEFILVGITNNPRMKVTLFILFLHIYVNNLLGNLGMIILIRMDFQLHIPMYFFLSHRSFCDLCYSTAVGPKMLVDIFDKDKSIPFFGCALQFFIACTFVDSECILLAVMALDRYKAISSPLLYTAHMSSRLCSLLVAGVYLVGLADALIHTTLTFRLCFCGSNEIDHFFCIPMYFFLSHRSFCDLCYSTAVGPKMLVDIFGKDKSIPFFGCALQFFIACTFVDSECILLVVMALDCYKAISRPLLYTAHMSSRLCSLLVAGVYLVGLADALIHTTLTFRLCFCEDNEIEFCDIPPILLLSCSETQINELAIFTTF